MINRLDRIILRDVLLLAIVCALGLTFLFTALSLYQIVNRFEVTPRFGTLVSFAPSLWISLMPMTLPISALFAATLVFGRMRADRELLLLSASGVAPWRPFVMMLPVGILVGAVSWLGVSIYGPGAYAERHSLQRQALADFIDYPPQGPRELRFPGRGGNEPSIDISYAEVDRGRYRNLRILVYNDLGLLATLSASSASIGYQRGSGTMVLMNCYEPRLIEFSLSSAMKQWDEDKSGDVSLEEYLRKGGRNAQGDFLIMDLDKNQKLDATEVPGAGRPSGTVMVADKVNELRLPFSFGSEDEPDAPKALGTTPLLVQVRNDVQSDKKVRGAAAELVRRTGLAAAGLLLPLLGALIASLVNHPNRLLAIGAGVIPCALGYYPLMTAATTLAEGGAISPTAGIIIAPLATIAAIIGVILGPMRSR